jgi:hypothetical protein
MLEMISHELSAHSSKRFLYGRDLHHDVSAITVAFDHSLDSTHLTLDSAKALQIPFFNVRIDGDCF